MKEKNVWYKNYLLSSGKQVNKLQNIVKEWRMKKIIMKSANSNKRTILNEYKNFCYHKQTSTLNTKNKKKKKFQKNIKAIFKFYFNSSNSYSIIIIVIMIQQMHNIPGDFTNEMLFSFFVLWKFRKIFISSNNEHKNKRKWMSV